MVKGVLHILRVLLIDYTSLIVAMLVECIGGHSPVQVQLPVALMVLMVIMMTLLVEVVPIVMPATAPATVITTMSVFCLVILSPTAFQIDGCPNLSHGKGPTVRATVSPPGSGWRS